MANKSKKYQPVAKDSNGLTAKGQEAMQRMIDRLKNGTVSELAQIMTLPIPADAPCLKWTIRNRWIAALTGGSADCRTGLQWEAVGRHITKEAAGKCGIICRPNPVFERDEKGNVIKEGDAAKLRFMAYAWVTVVPYQYTDGEPITEYEVQELPPLMDVAERMGVSVKWTPLLGAYGSAGGNEILMATPDFKTFFHELAHIADRRKHPKVKSGQEPEAETVAELCAAVLMELYCQVDRSGNAWEYIKYYNPDNPIKAVMQIMKRASDALELILQTHLEVSQESEPEAI